MEAFGNSMEIFANSMETFANSRKTFGNSRETFGSSRETFSNSILLHIPSTQNPPDTLKRAYLSHNLVELRRFELPASTMRMSRAPNCATAPTSMQDILFPHNSLVNYSSYTAALLLHALLLALARISAGTSRNIHPSARRTLRSLAPQISALSLHSSAYNGSYRCTSSLQ